MMIIVKDSLLELFLLHYSRGCCTWWMKPNLLETLHRVKFIRTSLTSYSPFDWIKYCKTALSTLRNNSKWMHAHYGLLVDQAIFFQTGNKFKNGLEM